MNRANVHSVVMSGPGDVAGIKKLFDTGVVDPTHVIGVIAQTEGDGYSRGYASQTLEYLFAEYLGLSRQEVFNRVPMMMIGGTAGLMCPHYTLFINEPGHQANANGGKRLVLGAASTRPLQPEEYGRATQVKLVAEAVEQAMIGAGITDANDVVCVELKVPQMTEARIRDAASRGVEVVSGNALAASGLSRGASALGAAIALKEVADVQEEDIGRFNKIYSQRASASSGGEQVACRAIVIGNVVGSPSSLVAGNSVMDNQTDLQGAYRAFRNAGLSIEEGCLTDESRARFVTAFANAGANYVGEVNGYRHTMNSDFLSAWAGHQAKAVVHAVLSGIVGHTLHLANAGAEHQGKPGSNLLCVIAGAKAE